MAQEKSIVNSGEDTCPVVVLGRSSTNFLGVIRAFGRRGIPVYTISNGPAGASSNRSRYITERLFIRRWEENELQESLLKLLPKLGGVAKIVVFPANDISLSVYSNIREQLPAVFVDSIPPKPLIDLSIAKDQFYECMAERKIAHPKSYPLDFVNKNIGCVEKYLSFPFLLKPVCSHLFVDQFQTKLFEVRSRKEFARFYHIIKENKMAMIAQELIPGNYFYMAYFYISKNRETKAMAGFRKVRQSPADYGTGSLVESFWDENLVNRALELLESLGYNGIAEVEYKYDPLQKQYKLLEINARSITFNRLSAAIGADMEYLSYLDALGGLDSRQVLTPQALHLKWLDFTKDIPGVILLKKEKKISLPGILKSYKGLKMDGYFALDDLSPFLEEARQLTKSGLRRLFWNHRQG